MSVDLKFFKVKNLPRSFLNEEISFKMDRLFYEVKNKTNFK